MNFTAGATEFVANVAESAVEALRVAVLPRTCLLDIERANARPRQPLLDLLGHELRAVVAPRLLGRASHGEQVLEHYAGIISTAQIDYMLAGRFSDEALREHTRAADRWLEILRGSGTPVGYCAYELADMQGSGRTLAALKHGQLYVLESHRGKGFGRFMLGRVESRACELGKRALWLQVNKRNTEAIRFYRAAGFEGVREAVFGIGRRLDGLFIN